MPETIRMTVHEWAPTEGLANVPEAAKATLEHALQRYLAINRVTCGVIPMKQVLKDRTANLDLYTPGEDGHAILDDSRQVEFMHRVTSLPRSWCAYWTYQDFLRLVAGGVIEGDPVELVEDAYEYALDITEEAIGF